MRLNLKQTDAPFLRASVPAAAAAFSAQPELSDWVTRVQGRGSDVTGTGVQTAVGDFIVGMKTDGLWTRGYRIGVYAGDALAALEAPLLNTYGDTTDTLTGFVAGNYTSTGLVGGSGKRINTGFAVSDVPGFGVNDFSFGCYCRNTTDGGIWMGAATNDGTGTAAVYFTHQANVMYTAHWDTNTQLGISDTGGIGFYLSSRTNTNDLKLYKNGVQIGSNTTNPGNNLSLFDWYIHDANLSNSPWAFTARSLCFYWIGRGCNSTQQANLRSRVQTLQTALSRQV